MCGSANMQMKECGNDFYFFLSRAEVFYGIGCCVALLCGYKFDEQELYLVKIKRSGWIGLLIV